MTFLIFTSAKPGNKPCLINLDDIIAVEPQWDHPGASLLLRGSYTVNVDNCVEDVVARVVAAKEGGDAK